MGRTSQRRVTSLISLLAGCSQNACEHSYLLHHFLCHQIAHADNQRFAKVFGWRRVTQGFFMYLCAMFVCRKSNRSGTTTIVVVSKNHGKFIKVKNFGTASTCEFRSVVSHFPSMIFQSYKLFSYTLSF